MPTRAAGKTRTSSDPWWSPEFEQAAISAAQAVYRQSTWCIELDDLKQEAFLYMLTHREEIEKCRSAYYAGWLLFHRLGRIAAREDKKFGGKEMSYEEWVIEQEGGN